MNCRTSFSWLHGKHNALAFYRVAAEATTCAKDVGTDVVIFTDRHV